MRHLKKSEKNVDPAESQDVLRQRWRAYWKEHEEYDKRREQYEEALSQWNEKHIYNYVRGLPSPPKPVAPVAPDWPRELNKLTCGAKTRAGTPCQLTSLYGGNGRCKFHGGASTGPKTAVGKAKAALNGLKPKRKKRSSWRGYKTLFS